MSAKNRNVIFTGSVASVTRRRPIPKPRKVAPRKVPAIVQDGPWKGATLYMAQLNGTLPMTIKGDTGRYVFQSESSYQIEGQPNRRRIVPAGLYWQGA